MNFTHVQVYHPGKSTSPIDCTRIFIQTKPLRKQSIDQGLGRCNAAAKHGNRSLFVFAALVWCCPRANARFYGSKSLDAWNAIRQPLRNFFHRVNPVALSWNDANLNRNDLSRSDMQGREVLRTISQQKVFNWSERDELSSELLRGVSFNYF